MAMTDFASQQDQLYLGWARETWKYMREKSFIMQRMGTGPQAGIQKITEFTSLPSGNKVIINLLHELVEDGVVGDDTLENREEAASMSQMEIVVDQVRRGVTNMGRMSDQKGVLKIRQEAKGLLAYAMADRIDQMAFLTMAGIPYRYRPDGSDRGAGASWLKLEFASKVTPPTTNRHFRWQASTSTIQPGDTTAVVPADTITYDSLVHLRALADDLGIRPLRDGPVPYYELYVPPFVMKSLTLDPKFHEAVKLAMPRANSNPIFQGAPMYWVDGLAIFPYTKVYNTRNATTKWGAAGDVVGARCTLMGAQGLAYGEIMAPMWTEEIRDHKARWAIGIAQILGFQKPQFPDPKIAGKPVEDFGLLSFDVAMSV